MSLVPQHTGQYRKQDVYVCLSIYIYIYVCVCVCLNSATVMRVKCFNHTNNHHHINHNHESTHKLIKGNKKTI